LDFVDAVGCAFNGVGSLRKIGERELSLHFVGWVVGSELCAALAGAGREPVRSDLRQDEAASTMRLSMHPVARTSMFRLFLTLLAAGEFLNNLTAFPGFDLFACIFHKFCEPAGQFVNRLRLPAFD
jgi:hypothetical protein